MIRAYPKENKFSIVADTNSEFFKILPILKQLGINKINDQWLVDESILIQIGAVKMIQVLRSRFCHTVEEIIWVSESQLAYGKIRGFCSLCDSHWNEEILICSIPQK